MDFGPLVFGRAPSRIKLQKEMLNINRIFNLEQLRTWEKTKKYEILYRVAE
jgi:hypothetical protein